MKQPRIFRASHAEQEKTYRPNGGESPTSSAVIQHRNDAQFRGVIPHLSDLFSYTASRSYGFLLLSFGVLTLLLNFGFSYFGFGQNDIVSALIVGTVCSLLAVPLLFTNTPFCLLMQDFVPTSVFFFDFLCIRKQPRIVPKAVLPLWLCIGIGILLSIVGFLFPLVYLLMAVAAVLFLSLSFSSPEFPLLTALLLMPYLPLTGKMPIYLASMIGIAFLAFVCKFLLGKRIFLFDAYDFLLIVLALAFLIFGALHGIDSFENALILAILTFSFPLTCNLISNPRLVECAENALLVSAVPIGVLTVLKAFGLGGAETSELLLPVCGLFDSPAAYARFLVPVAIISLALASERRPKYEIVLYLLSFILASLNLVFTLRINAWIAFLAGLTAFLCLNSKRVLSPLLAFPILLGVGLFFLPDATAAAIDGAVGRSDFSLASLKASGDAMLSMLSDHFLTGVGFDAAEFDSVLSSYSDFPIPTGVAGNLLLYLGCGAGIVAVGLLLALLFTRIRHRFSFRIFCRFSTLRTQNATAAATVYALFFLGITENLFSATFDYFLFFFLFGLGSALLRMSKTEYNERRAYYGNDNNSAEASVVDIIIKN